MLNTAVRSEASGLPDTGNLVPAKQTPKSELADRLPKGMNKVVGDGLMGAGLLGATERNRWEKVDTPISILTEKLQEEIKHGDNRNDVTIDEKYLHSHIALGALTIMLLYLERTGASVEHSFFIDKMRKFQENKARGVNKSNSELVRQYDWVDHVSRKTFDKIMNAKETGSDPAFNESAVALGRLFGDMMKFEKKPTHTPLGTWKK